MDNQEAKQGYKTNYTQESFEEVLQQAYDSLEPNDIVALICKTADFFNQEEFDNGKIRNITKSVINKRNISFKQWKALSAYVSSCSKKQQTKNNKTF